jgi:hypothetical protein
MLPRPLKNAGLPHLDQVEFEIQARGSGLFEGGVF